MAGIVWHDWTVEALGWGGTGPAPVKIPAGRIRANVPGCVHEALQRAGTIPDPFVGTNEASQRWVGSTGWRYRVAFRTDRSIQTPILQLQVDGIADVLVDGGLVGALRSAHLTHEVPLPPLSQGLHELWIDFPAQVPLAEAEERRLGWLPHVERHPFNAVRRMACSFGWDWGPDLVTCGPVTTPVILDGGLGRLHDVQWSVQAIGERGGRVQVSGTVSGAVAGGRVELEVAGNRVVAEAARTFSATVELDDVGRWWPLAHGEQRLYPAHVGLCNSDGDQLDRVERRIGFRSVEWRVPREDGSAGLECWVNGRFVHARGACWIPNHPYLHLAHAPAVRQRLEQAAAANLCLVRVWGGGTFESEEFYNACDELGLLVWQDFPFTGAGYHEDSETEALVVAESRQALARLSSHPCLALLCGNNEVLWAVEDWPGWPGQLQGRTWGERYFRELLPTLVDELVPGTAYVPGSPFSPDGQPENDPQYGCTHLWDLWNEFDAPAYLAKRPRFVSEFGWQAPPPMATIREMAGGLPASPDDPVLVAHQKAHNGRDRLDMGLVPHVPRPTGIVDWHWATQLVQAHALRLALDHFRAQAPRCAGALVWQLNDCWPSTSWSLVDHAGREKPAWHAVREACAPRALGVAMPGSAGTGDRLTVWLHNDTDEVWDGPVRVARRGLDGDAREQWSQPLRVGPRDIHRVELPWQSLAEDELLDVGVQDLRRLWFPVEFRDQALGRPRFGVQVRGTVRGWCVEVCSDQLVRALFLMVDELDPCARLAGPGPVDLLPGETARFEVASFRSPPSPADARAALRSANQLLHAV